ncbi:glucose-6-phosphate isomerase [Enterobacteriaceae endosymbiont of Donacia tomentosa]|uniref:glucose-6-phosphate isomerase n=1 Tax=Enterobacteriaceae endosymbiont of Donacia tomentosa TaxID=2675787 RepID=UPI001449AF14|nr:glucose-6-phosphate isomerase [Enterobacteriaceae endosymbiont of Donacia tomentosa]QJC31736.1 glucose-6-phosphate isomerase [Enterobacteriaceae endosymbiont of Donacia tomentosa]
MKNINPTKTKSWQILKNHFVKMQKVTINHLFKKNKNRFVNFSINFKNEIIFDYSKNIIDKKTIYNLINLAKETNCIEAIYDMFYGEKINVTEKRAVLHVAARYNKTSFFLKNKSIYNNIDSILEKIEYLSNNIISGKWKSYTNKKIKNIINIGIGGSNLGPLMIIESLRAYKNNLNIYFLSNVDYSQLINITQKIKPEESLFIVSSKTFTTQETLTNFISIKEWLIKNIAFTNLNDLLSQHFIAITNNINAAIQLGISKNNIVPLLSEIGGRFSLWSSIGLPISLSIGFNNFKRLLEGAMEMDNHFFTSPLNSNIPVIMALISIWYSNFWKTETEAVIPYSNDMRFLPQYLQQLNMESNGKSIDRNGNKIFYETSPIIWGDVGTNGQHSFFQMLHQGTKIIPCDFIASVIPNFFSQNHHNKLISNFIAQTQALAFGNIKNNTHEKNIYKLCFGNNPSNSIFLRKITPNNLGSLIAFYEHKIFIQGIILNIFSFDQWGVELGKQIANIILNNHFEEDIKNNDSSTNGLINFYKLFN